MSDTPKRTSILKPFFDLPVRTRAVAILILVMLVILLIGPQRVQGWVGKVFGSLPGAESASSSQEQGLAKPVEYSQDGITLRVEELVATSKTTQLVYTISGLPENITPQIAYLQLLNGASLYNTANQQTVQATSGAGKNYRVTATFDPLPEGSSDIRIVWERQATNQVGQPDLFIIPIHIQPK